MKYGNCNGGSVVHAVGGLGDEKPYVVNKGDGAHDYPSHVDVGDGSDDVSLAEVADGCGSVVYGMGREGVHLPD